MPSDGYHDGLAAKRDPYQRTLGAPHELRDGSGIVYIKILARSVEEPLSTRRGLVLSAEEGANAEPGDFVTMITDEPGLCEVEA